MKRFFLFSFLLFVVTIIQPQNMVRVGEQFVKLSRGWEFCMRDISAGARKIQNISRTMGFVPVVKNDKGDFYVPVLEKRSNNKLYNTTKNISSQMYFVKVEPLSMKYVQFYLLLEQSADSIDTTRFIDKAISYDSILYRNDILLNRDFIDSIMITNMR